ncbi:ATP-binding cassette domain-containing protein [Parasphingorhabdus sp.]|uniref:ATP-binding cassette domain-containing protein n=1 Tax=Parasphingorhabdus sp. TaxID=2709688 RepID=UPI002B27B5F8|nr:ATP-binding cassette domain-containing protein [Parasphingorhabdus sp.]
MDLTVIGGPNFSGRTERLRSWTGLPVQASDEATKTDNAFIGPDPVNALSGFAPTVLAELELMARDRDAFLGAKRAIEELGFGPILQQNPFTLSGGEQVVVATVAAAAGRPSRLAIDCAFEQLAADTRSRLLSWLETLDGELMVADNRLDEWYHGKSECQPASPHAPVIKPQTPERLQGTGIKIEIVDLCFSYPRGRQIFDRLNLTLEPNHAYHLRGPNGVGKTTLSKLLCGLLRPQKGEIRVNGVAVKPWRTPGQSVGYHFQNPTFQLFANSVHQQLANGATDMSLSKEFGLEEMLDAHPLDLPYVLRKRLAIAATIGRGRDCVVFDEPTLGQDVNASNAISTILQNIGGIRITHSFAFSNLAVIAL